MQAVFLALQANTTVTWNWGLVLLPVWVHIVKQYVFGYLLWDWGQRVSKGLGAEVSEQRHHLLFHLSPDSPNFVPCAFLSPPLADRASWGRRRGARTTQNPTCTAPSAA